jgi:hypothetical protein
MMLGVNNIKRRYDIKAMRVLLLLIYGIFS